MQKARGSAIVIAMLLVSAVGAVGFTFGKVLNIQITNESLYESGLGAYYGAESGMEEGFLRYRFSRGSAATVTDAQVPTFASAAFAYPTMSWLGSPNNVIRTNLSSSTVSGNQISGVVKSTTAGRTDLNSQVYDLRMGAVAGTTSGDPTFVSAGDPNYAFRIARDETRKIDLGNIFAPGISSDITLKFKITPSTSVALPPASTVADNECVLVEAKLELQPVSGPIIERKKLLYNSNNSNCPYGNIISDLTTAYPYPMPADKIVSIINLKTILAGSVLYNKATLFLKPIGAGIDYSLTETGTVPGRYPLNGATSTVISTGYYGGVARTLEADIDLRNGSLYDLYDYVIYKN